MRSSDFLSLACRRPASHPRRKVSRSEVPFLFEKLFKFVFAKIHEQLPINQRRWSPVLAGEIDELLVILLVPGNFEIFVAPAELVEVVEDLLAPAAVVLGVNFYDRRGFHRLSILTVHPT